MILAHGGRRTVDLGGDTATARASAWLADAAKRSLLAQVGVGTIDQALQAVLRTRHSTVRLSGLVRKVLVVDEVHAYDPYMSSLISTLLEAHARAGGSAILLSATLANPVRARLLSSWRAGGGSTAAETCLQSRAYPLLTVAGRDDIDECPIEAAPRAVRQVGFLHVRASIPDAPSERLLRFLLRQAARGHCVAWIRNTVDDAVRAFRAVEKRLGDRAHLLHARFVQGDRARIERGLVDRFGRRGTREGRRGHVVIATQVIEQSLDLDFDVLVTDVAPVEVMLQRAGRCQRHDRGFRIARVFVVAPDAATPEQWLQSVGPSRFVYRDQGRVWLSLQVLRSRVWASLPEDARHWVDAVYESDDPLPVALREASSAANAEAVRVGAIGDRAAIALKAGYSTDAQDWIDEFDVTRLGRPSSALLLLREGLPLRGSLEESIVKVPGRWQSNVASTAAGPWHVAIELGRAARRDGATVMPGYDERTGFAC